METKGKNELQVLASLRLSSSYFYSIEPHYDFTVTSEMIKAEQNGRWEDWRKDVTLCNFFLAAELNFNEERNISTQVFRCCIPMYPVDDVLNLLDNDWDKLCWTQRQVKAFVNNYGEKILSILKIEEPKLSIHLLFLGKNDNKYRLIHVYFKNYATTELYYSVCGFEHLSMCPSGFLIVPLRFPDEIIYKIIDS